MATYVPPKRGVECIFYIGLISQADTKTFQANPTIAAGDFKVSTDGGSLTNLGTLPAVTPAGGKAVKITLSAAEMTGDNIMVVCSDASGAEWCDSVILLQTSGTQLEDITTQVSAIGTGTGAALNFEAVDDNTDAPLNSVTFVGTQTGTYANTYFDNGTTHQIASVANAFDLVYKFSVGSGRNAAKVVIRANMAAANDTASVQAYNFNSSTWQTIGSITGTTETLYDIALLSGNTGTGANAGIVYIRFVFSEADAGTIVIDQCYVQAQNLGQTVGYADGAIWIGGTNANTTPYVDGTADNPCTYAAAVTLAASLGLTRFRVRNGTTVTLASTAANRSFIGANWTLALGGQAIDGAYFEGAEVSGTATCTTQAEFVDCHINAGTTAGPSKFLRCGFAGTSGSPFTAGSAGEYLFMDCVSEVAGSGTPYFTMSGASGVNFRRWSGGSNITLNNASATLTMEVVTGGGQTIATAGANVEIRGICRAITLTGIASGATCQIDCITGPISLAGANGTVNIYGVCGTVTDSRSPAGTLLTSANTGYSLAATGLDAIAVTAPTTVATTFPQMVVQTWRRFFKKATKTSTELKTFADNNTTVVTTQTVSDDGTTETQGTAS